MKKIAFRIFLIVGAASMSVMAASYFNQAEDQFLSSKSLSTEFWYVLIFKLHIAFGIISILTGAFQLIPSIRKRWINLHRWIGKLYVGSIFVSATCGLVIAQLALGGLITRMGFSILSLLWFYFTYLAYTHARNGNISMHRTWMYRSYALTFSSLTLRIFLLTALFTSIPFLAIYQFASWGCWITNLIVCELILSRKKLMAIT